MLKRTWSTVTTAAGVGVLVAGLTVPAGASSAAAPDAAPSAAIHSSAAAVRGLHAAAVAARTAARPAGLVVVADHLNNPRGLEIAPNGDVLDAEAGSGGRPCSPAAGCVGFTGSVLRVHAGIAQRVIGGLVSSAGHDGSFAVGSDDVTAAAHTVYMIETSAGLPNPPGLPSGAAAQLGRVLAYDSSGLHSVADIARYEFRHDPDGQGPDSDPYAIQALPGGSLAVADAAGNDVLRVAPDGTISVLAVLPNNVYGRNSVPTSLALGPDGALYVGELGGDGTPAGGARVWRIAPRTHLLSEYATGFTDISGIGFGPDGSFYVTELTRDPTFSNPSGDVVRVAPNGSRTRLGQNLIAPAGVAVDAAGNIYVNNASILPAYTDPNGPFGGLHGQLVRIVRPAG